MLSTLPPALFASFSIAVRRPEPPSLSRPLVPSAVYDPTIMNLGIFRSPFEHAVRPSRGFVDQRATAWRRRARPQSVALALRAGVSQYLPCDEESLGDGSALAWRMRRRAGAAAGRAGRLAGQVPGRCAGAVLVRAGTRRRAARRTRPILMNSLTVGLSAGRARRLAGTDGPRF